MKSSSTSSAAGTSAGGVGQAGKNPGLLHALGSLRLAVALMSILIGLSALATWIGQQDTSTVALERLYSPELIYVMKLAGLTDVLRSGWFVSLLGLLALNLVCAAIVNWGAAWKSAFTRVPAAVNAAQILSSKAHSRGADRYVRLEMASPIGREQFRELVKAWSRGRVGTAHAVRDQGGTHELQLVAQRGRFTKVSLHLAHLSILLVLAGAALGSVLGFEGRLDLDEGARVPYIQVTRGSSQDWPGLRQFGRVFPGFYEPGFEVECGRFDVENYPLTDRVKSMRSSLNFYRDGKLVATREAAVNSPATFESVRFLQSGYAKNGNLRAAVSVLDRLPPAGDDEPGARMDAAPGEVQQFGRVLVGHRYPLDGGSFRLLQVEESGGERGPAARVEYTPEGGAPETFWIFQRFPKFDEVSRRSSRHVFTLNGLAPGFGTSLLVTGDPGRPWVWAGGILLVLSLFYSMLFAHDRYWFVWKPGKVVVIGASSKMMLFEPRFERLMDGFRARVAKAAPRGDDDDDDHGAREGRDARPARASRKSRAAKTPAPGAEPSPPPSADNDNPGSVT